MDKPEVIKGRKQIVLEDCEDVYVKRGQRIQVIGADQLAVIDCRGTSYSTIWQDFQHNHVTGDMVGNVFPKQGKVIADSARGFVFHDKSV